MHPSSDEPTGISPCVDYVFRAILGVPERSTLLLDFLNAVLARPVPVTGVELVNPAHLPDFIGDDHTVLDVKATDAAGETFQVEMQSWNRHALKERMLYDWADLYEKQLVAGQGVDALRPVTAIWILDENTLRGATDFHHRFTVSDVKRGVTLTSHLEIHLLELPRWRKRPDPAATAGMVRWMRFFSEAQSWTEVPPEIDHPVLEAAMAVLHEFQVNREWNDAYRSRLSALRVQWTQESALRTAIAEKEQALAREERLRAKLRAAGIDPDA